MTEELEETFGSDFVEQFEEEVNARRRERERITDEQKAEIAHDAVNNAKFKDGNPTFDYKTENGITHDVLLMMLPDPDGEPIWNRVNKLDSGAVTCPLDYMGQWWSCLFNNPEDLERMEPGDYYIVVGEQTVWEAESGQEYEQVSPVRGVISLDEARDLAAQYLDDDTSINEPGSEDEATDDEPEEDENDDTPAFGGSSDDDGDEDEEEDDSPGFLSGDDDGDEDDDEDDEPFVSYSDVANEVEELADKDDAVWEVSEGDERLNKLIKIIAKRLGVEPETQDDVDDIKQAALDRIQEESDDDDDDDDSLF